MFFIKRVEFTTKSVQNQAVMQQKQIKDQPVCKIEWNALSTSAWCSRFQSVSRSNLLQSPDYLYAMARLNYQKVSYGLIYINGEEAGLVGVLEAGLFKNALHGVIIDRGPLWFDEYGTSAHFKAFMAALLARYPKRFGRRMRFMPEIVDSSAHRHLIESFGLKRVYEGAYQTHYLDLTQDREGLRAGLHKKWRNTLKKSERAGLEILWSTKLDDRFSWAVQKYAQDKAQRSYDGPSVKAVLNLAKQFSYGQNILVGTAVLDGQPIAAIVLYIHGKGATYQIGYTSEKGRETCAHHALLWQACLHLKERNVHDFDLGGVNDKDAKGVKTFKQGMGGTLYEIPGLYT